jgi:histidine ammonia-lyase
MLAQVTAAALASECKGLAHPSSVDSIPTSGNQEDHVSMGMNAALKLQQLVGNVEQVVATELLCAAQALEFLKPLTPARSLQDPLARIRAAVPPLVDDRPPAPDLEKLAAMVREGAFAE